jgi:two-component system phosphate regulon sensor histidine kinase PhoR
MLHSIRWRITISFTILTLIILGVLGGYLTNTIGKSQLDGLRTQLKNEALITAEASVPAFLGESNHPSLDILAKKLGEQIDARITIIALNGIVLGDSEEDPTAMDNHADRPEVIAAVETGIGISTRYSITLGEEMMYVAVPVYDQETILGTARVSLAVSSVDSLVNRMTVTIIIAMVIAALIVVLAAWLITRTITKPIKDVTEAAEIIASGELGHRILINTKDEASQLAHAFNQMSSKLQEMIATISDDKARLETVLDNMADGIIMTDKGSNIQIINKATEKIFGASNREVTDRPLIEVVRDFEIDELLKSCLETGQGQVIQFESGASQRFLRVIAIPLHGGKLDGAILLIQDLTEIKGLQTMRQELIGNISHEFRTPLAGIKAMVETMREGAVDDKELARDFLARIEDEVNRLMQLVAELTELSRIETGGAQLELGPVDLNSLLEDTITQLTPQAARNQLTIRHKPSGDLPSVNADRERIRKVIINLLHNAIKFTGAGGNITVTAKVAGGKAIVTIADTGLGIAREDLPHIFERFYKSDKGRSGGGTGMGLAIAKHIIEAHGGSIQVDSEEGQGATFSFSLPLGSG